MRETNINKGVGLIYEEPLTIKQRKIRYAMRFHRGEKEFPHGKAWCYSQLGCRREGCRLAELERQRKYRKVSA
jgi:hypothetical protein